MIDGLVFSIVDGSESRNDDVSLDHREVTATDGVPQIVGRGTR